MMKRDLNIIIHLERIYCTSIGIEYMYIRTPERIKWIQNYLNDNDNKPQLSDDQRKHILKKLIQANNFESFLHKKYVGITIATEIITDNNL